MANVQVVPPSKTLAEYIAENESLKARVATLESASKLNMTVKVAKYGVGAISISGLQRFPVSLHAAQWPELFTRGPIMVRQFLKDNADTIRCYSVAAEYALKATGLKTVPAVGEATRKAYESAWDAGLALATADKTLVPSSPKYRSAESILAAWTESK